MNVALLPETGRSFRALEAAEIVNGQWGRAYGQANSLTVPMMRHPRWTQPKSTFTEISYTKLLTFPLWKARAENNSHLPTARLPVQQIAPMPPPESSIPGSRFHMLAPQPASYRDTSWLRQGAESSRLIYGSSSFSPLRKRLPFRSSASLAVDQPVIVDLQ